MNIDIDTAREAHRRRVRPSVGPDGTIPVRSRRRDACHARRWIRTALVALLAGGSPALAGAESAARIVGGDEAAADAWPWQVALIEPRGSGFSQFCGGSVIAPRWVLTAAHCVRGARADEIQVLVGTNDLDEGGRRLDVSAIRVHEDYVNVERGSDIALLRLAEPAGVEAIALPDAAYSAEVAVPGTSATVTGWGLLRAIRCEPGTKPGAHECETERHELGYWVDDLTDRTVDLSDVTTTRLMEVEVPLVRTEACRSAYADRPYAAIDGRTLCAGLRRGTKDSCQGDSGGPLVVRDGDRWLQAGVVSWGISCAKPGRYGVYANVGAFADWVEGETGLGLAMAGTGAHSGESAAQPAPSTATTGPDRGDRALVIGVDRYADPKFDLQGAVYDAHNVRRLLTGHLGFGTGEVRVLTDERATRDAILAGVRDWLIDGTEPGSRALFYFAGHGYHVRDTDGDEPDGLDEALVPHDARVVSAATKPARMKNLILDDELQSLFAELRDRQAYLIADSCHSGTVTRAVGAPDPGNVRTIDLRIGRRGESSGARGGLRSVAGEPGFVESEGNLVSWTAVTATQLALEDVDAPERQGVFTRRFVRGLAEKRADRNGDGRVVHAELLDYVRTQSDAYCEAHPDDCRWGLTPLLEGPPGTLAREVIAGGAPSADTPAAVADSALGHDNSAGVKLEILPSARLRVGEEVRYRLRSRRPGHLLIVDVGADGTVRQMFPNAVSDERGVGAAIKAGQEVVIPNRFYGFSFVIEPPVGFGSLFAVVTEDPVSLEDLTRHHKEFRPVADSRDWLLALGERLREPWMDEDDGVREARWSMAEAEYEIVP